MNKKIVLTAIVSVLITSVVMLPIGGIVFAEQSGGSPESGVVSRIGELFGFYETRGQGSEEAGDWGDYGSMWNRIYSNRVDYSLQALVEYDDYEGPDGNGEAVDDYMGEEATWTNTLPLAGGEEVWKDERSGLYWSHTLSTSMTNIFPNQDHSTCPFFDGSTEEERLTSRYEYDGLTGACGNAINACGSLELDADGDGVDETNWYLPTQKELQQAYMDGMFNQTGSAFTTTNLFWSSSEVSYPSGGAWLVGLLYGYSNFNGKTNVRAVRCVARD